MTDSEISAEAAGGLRERKRQETLRRITDAGVRLFTAHGYEATTLDQIAAEAGISRRTFFHYFKSKDEILLSMQRGLGESIAAGLARQPTDQPPLTALRKAMLEIVAPYTSEELLKPDRLMRASEAVQSRKQAGYILDEATVFATLRRLWPAEPELALRLVAMLAIGTSRVSLDAWSRDGGIRPLETYVVETFEMLESLFGR